MGRARQAVRYGRGRHALFKFHGLNFYGCKTNAHESARAGSASLRTRIASNALWGFAPRKRPRVSGARHSARLAVARPCICARSVRKRSETHSILPTKARFARNALFQQRSYMLLKCSVTGFSSSRFCHNSKCPSIPCKPMPNLLAVALVTGDSVGKNPPKGNRRLRCLAILRAEANMPGIIYLQALSCALPFL